MAAELVAAIDNRLLELLMIDSQFGSTLDNRMVASWNAPNFANKIHEIIEPALRNIHQRIDGGSRTEKPFDDKRAERLAPPDFHGRADKNISFDNFADQFKNWASAVYEHGLYTVESMEDLSQDAATIAQKLGDPNLKAFSGRIYEVLIKAAKGEVTAFVKNPQRDGLTAWRRLLQQYDPREQVDETIAYEKVTRPTPAKNIAEARVKVPQWLNEMGVYVAKFGDNSLTEPARLLALKTLVPASLLGNGSLATVTPTTRSTSVTSRISSETARFRSYEGTCQR